MKELINLFLHRWFTKNGWDTRLGAVTEKDGVVWVNVGKVK